MKLGRREFLSTAAAATVLGTTGVAFAEEPAENRICKLFGIKKPVIQAWMDGGVSAKLAAAVSNAGGLGTVQLQLVDEMKTLTDKPFAVLVYAQMVDDELIAELKEKGVQIVITGSANNPPVDDPDIEAIEPLKEAGFTVVFKGCNVTAEKVQAVQDAGADAMIVIGYGAGGTAPKLPRSVSALLANFRGKFDMPLIAAGGIVNSASAAGVIALGAEAVYCGTRFMLSEEGPLPDVSKQALLDSDAANMVYIGAKWFNYRLSATPANVEFAQTHTILMPPDGLSSEYSARGSAAVWGMASGELEDGGVCCGEGVDSIECVLPAAEIVNEIATAFGL